MKTPIRAAAQNLAFLDFTKTLCFPAGKKLIFGCDFFGGEGKRRAITRRGNRKGYPCGHFSVSQPSHGAPAAAQGKGE